MHFLMSSTTIASCLYPHWEVWCALTFGKLGKYRTWYDQFVCILSPEIHVVVGKVIINSMEDQYENTHLADVDVVRSTQFQDNLSRGVRDSPILKLFQSGQSHPPRGDQTQVGNSPLWVPCLKWAITHTPVCLLQVDNMSLRSSSLLS